jgi:hypothetical protein
MNDPTRLRDDPDAPKELRALGALPPPRALGDADRARILATAALLAAGGGAAGTLGVKAATKGAGLAKGLAVTVALAGLAVGVRAWRTDAPDAPPRAVRAGSAPDAVVPSRAPDAVVSSRAPDAVVSSRAPDAVVAVVRPLALPRPPPRVARVVCPVAVSEGEARVLEAASAALASSPRVAAACEASLPDRPASPLYEERLFVRWDAARRLQRRDEAARAAETLRRMFPASRYARVTATEPAPAPTRDGFRPDASAW